MPMTDWKVLLKGQAPGLYSWEDFLANQQLLAENQTNDTAGVVGAAREGGALLQGLILCGRCGRRMAPRYGGATGRARVRMQLAAPGTGRSHLRVD